MKVGLGEVTKAKIAVSSLAIPTKKKADDGEEESPGGTDGESSRERAHNPPPESTPGDSQGDNSDV